jgi:N-acyl homoserine lactone hydrolase
MPVATEPRPAQLPLPGGEAGATVRVHPVLSGEIQAPPAWIDRPTGTLAGPRTLAQLVGPRGDWDWLPIQAFLVEHPGVGPILIDTGLHPSCATDLGASMGRAAKLIYRVRMEHDQALRFQLARRGVEPSEVRVVIMTHMHFDHASAISEFPGATFVVDGREWRAAVDGGARRGYHARQFDHAFDWRTVDYDAPEVESFAGFSRTLDLFGDGSVRLASTPGHTLGHQSVVLRTRGSEVLAMGDAAYTERELRGEATPLLVADEHLRRRSLQEIRLYLRQTPGAVAIPGHDPALWPKLKRLYE